MRLPVSGNHPNGTAPTGFLERQRRLVLWSQYAIVNTAAIPPKTRYHNVIRQDILPGLPPGLPLFKETLFPPSVQRQSAAKVERDEDDH
jgi:hypothetical protein